MFGNSGDIRPWYTIKIFPTFTLEHLLFAFHVRYLGGHQATVHNKNTQLEYISPAFLCYPKLTKIPRLSQETDLLVLLDRETKTVRGEYHTPVNQKSPWGPPCYSVGAWESLTETTPHCVDILFVMKPKDSG